MENETSYGDCEHADHALSSYCDFRGLRVALFLAKSPHQATWTGDDFNNESTWSFWCGHAKENVLCRSCIVRMGL